jgi:hypothetical protein
MSTQISQWSDNYLSLFRQCPKNGGAGKSILGMILSLAQKYSEKD